METRKREAVKASTTLMRFHLKTHRFQYVFTSRPHCNDRKWRPSFSEIETFENASESETIENALIHFSVVARKQSFLKMLSSDDALLSA